MQELITKNYNGFNIEFELIDGHLMANATAMCAAFGKRPADWTKTAATKRFIEAKGRKIVLAVNQMVTSRYGGDENGTWIHECLILKLAAWLDTDFEIQCDEWVAELLRVGKVELPPAPPVVLTAVEMLLQQCQALVEQERRMSVVETRMDAIEHKTAQVVAAQTTIGREYYTVAGFGSLHHLRLDRTAAASYGRRAAMISRDLEYEIGTEYDAKYGKVNTYHIDILKRVFMPPSQGGWYSLAPIPARL